MIKLAKITTEKKHKNVYNIIYITFTIYYSIILYYIYNSTLKLN